MTSMLRARRVPCDGDFGRAGGCVLKAGRVHEHDLAFGRCTCRVGVARGLRFGVTMAIFVPDQRVDSVDLRRVRPATRRTDLKPR